MNESATVPRRILACHHDQIPSTHIRLRRPLTAWAERFGGEVRLTPEHLASDRDVLWADAVILSRGATVFSERVRQCARRWARPLVMDLDDHLLAIPSAAHSASFYQRRSTQRRVRRLLRESDLTILSTAALQRAVGSLCRASVVIPNTTPADVLAKRAAASVGTVTALLVSSDHLDAPFLATALAETLERHPALSILCIGEALPGFSHSRFHRVPAMPLDAYLALLAEHPIDFALAPVERSAFHDCKSNIKFLDFAAMAIPGVHSEGPVYGDCGDDLRRVANTAEAWRDAITWMVEYPDERRAMGERAREFVREHFTPPRAAEQWEEALQTLPRPERIPPRRIAPSDLRVLVFAPEAVGENFTGPTLRSLAMARELARDHRVTLAAPNATDLFAREAFDTATWSRRTAGALANRFDIVISTGLQCPASAMIGADTVQVFDLCDPILFEIMVGGGTAAGSGHHLNFLRRLTRLMLLCGDHFLCASERQRDLWLGALYIAGRFGPDSHAPLAPPSDLISVVPFGHDGAPAPRDTPTLRGVHPNIHATDKIILWGGGIWDWFDPLTLVRAVAEIQKERDDVKLYFLGWRPSEAGHHDHAMAARARALASDLGVLDTAVFFNPTWTSRRGCAEHLAEADLAVCTAPDTLENHFAFRARLVDAVQAGVPIICTEGSPLAEFVEENEIGLTVAAENVTDLREKIIEALRPERQTALRRNFALCRDALRWDICMEPLRQLCRRVAAGDLTHEPPPRLARWGRYLRYKIPSVLDMMLGR